MIRQVGTACPHCIAAVAEDSAAGTAQPSASLLTCQQDSLNTRESGHTPADGVSQPENDEPKGSNEVQTLAGASQVT